MRGLYFIILIIPSEDFELHWYWFNSNEDLELY